MFFEYQHTVNVADYTPVSTQDCFNALTEDQKKMVQNSTTMLEFESGETIIKQGYVASHILYLEKGLAKLEVTNDAKTSTVKLLGNDSFVGIMCSFACHSLNFSAVALEDCTIQMIDMEVFLSLVRENGEFAIKFIRHMSAKTNSMVHWMSRLSNKNVAGALTMILLEFSEIYASHIFTLPVTRVGLSALVGCSKESVINVLTQFHEDGLLEVNGKHIKILKPDSLNLILRNG